LTALAQTDLAALKEAAFRAALRWMGNQDCAEALMEFEDAVGEYLSAVGVEVKRKLSHGRAAE
jgi:hypothetical protein